MIRAIFFTIFAIACAVLLDGCVTAQKLVCKPKPPIPSFHPVPEGSAIRRVALLPLYHGQETENTLREMDAAFNAELTKTSLFELVPISRAEMETLTSHRQIPSVEVLPRDLLSQLVARYGVDAVLFTDVTHYFPYQPIAIGVRSKLVDVRTGEIRWASDYLFDSGKPDVAETARCYYLQNSQTNLPIQDDGKSVLQSPARFARYVAYETYRSLRNQTSPGVAKIVLNSPQKPPIF